MVDSEGSLTALVQEYHEVKTTASLDELCTTSNNLKNSLLVNLKEFHKEFLPVANKISDLRSSFHRIDADISELNKKSQADVIPHLSSMTSELIENRSPGTSPSECHSAAVDKLKELLEVRASCEYLLKVHYSLQHLEDRVDSLSRHLSGSQLPFNKMQEHGVQPSDIARFRELLDTEEFTDDMLDFLGPKESTDMICRLEDEIGSIVSSVLEMEDLMSQKTFFEKSEITVFQSFQSSYCLIKTQLRSFVDKHWDRLIQISEYSAANPIRSIVVASENVLCALEVRGNRQEIESLLNLIGALGETKKIMEKLCKDVWDKIFLPWLESQKKNSKKSPNNLQLQLSDPFTVGVQSPTCHSAQLWCLSLVEVKNKDETDGIRIVVEMCNQLTVALQGLSDCLFGLNTCSLKRDGSAPRIADFCIPVGVFGRCMVNSLLDGVLLNNLPLSQGESSKLTQFIYRVSAAVMHLKETAVSLGFLEDHDIDGQPCLLNTYLEQLEHLVASQQEYLYSRQVLQSLEDTSNFFAVEKVGGTPRVAAEKDPKKLSPEEEIEEAELLRLLDLTHLDFPACQVSKAVMQLLSYLDGIIADAAAILDSEIQRYHVNDNEARSDRQKNATLTILHSLIRRVPRLLSLYVHSVPTIHSDRMKSDTRFLAIYHNDCLYLAHECLTMGKLKLYPLMERIAKSTICYDPESEKPCDIALSLPQIASISTIQLVAQFREAGTSALLDRLREQRDLLQSNFRVSKGLRDPSNAGADSCQKALVACVTQILRLSKELDVLPLTVYLRCLGALCEEFVKLICNAILKMEDITTLDCNALIGFITSVISSISSIFEKHLDAAFALSSNLEKMEEKPLETLLTRRIPSWNRLDSIVCIMRATSLEEIRQLWLHRSLTGDDQRRQLKQLQPQDLKLLVTALYRDSKARSALLRCFDS